MSEETKVKNIEWLKEEVQNLPVQYYKFNILRDKDEYLIDKEDVLELFRELDKDQ